MRLRLSPTCLGLLVLPWLLTGCLEDSILIKVKKDGSGTITQQRVFASQAVQRLEALGRNAGGFKYYDKQLCSERASLLGEGVEFIRGRELELGDGRRGFVTEYRFKDITKVTGIHALGDQRPYGRATKTLRGPWYHFQLGKEDTNTILQIIPDWRLPAEGQPDAPLAEVPPLDNDAKKFLSGVRVCLFVKVDGNDVQSNATYMLRKNTNTVVLADLQFSELHDNLAQLAKLDANTASMPQMLGKYAQDNTPGVQFENPRKTVTISFK